MTLNLHLVAAGNREWATWLACDAAKKLERGSYLMPQYYRQAGQYLVLVHRPGRTDASNYRALIERAPELRDRLWILFYTGGGAIEQVPDDPHMHFLGYPIVDSPAIGAAEQACFTRAISILRSGEKLDAPRFWSAFYPPDNVSLVTLFALIAAERSGVSRAKTQIQLFAEDDRITTTYRQYYRAATLFAHDAPWPFERWSTHVVADDHNQLAAELARVLGTVPD